MTQFIGVNDLGQMVGTMGPRRFIRRLVDYLAEDFGRWDMFDKVARVASHSPIGVIELMPTSDGACVLRRGAHACMSWSRRARPTPIPVRARATG